MVNRAFKFNPQLARHGGTVPATVLTPLRFDWMHAAVAGREGCQEIVTSNLKHFRECTPLKLVEPADYLAR